MRSHYRLGERLGAGGMGEVFRATRLCAKGVERAVAIKRIHPALAHEDRFVQMFIREAQVMCKLTHPNIVSLWGFERDTAGQLFLVMEYVDGVDLDKLLDSGRLPHSVIIFLVAEILSGLGHAHHLPTGDGPLGVVHRDLSPHNILLSWYGAVKVADFGLAKFRTAREVSASVDLQGKPAFMSPEQACGRSLDGRSDLFTVGIMLWEMLTGERLFSREQDGQMATLWRVTGETIIRPGLVRPVAADLEAVVMRLLERDLRRRYPSAEVARESLLACADASKLARVELERILAERFPEALARRALPPVRTPVLEPRRHTETVLKVRRERAALRRRRWAVIAVVACAFLAVSVGTLAGLIATRVHSAPGFARPSVSAASSGPSSLEGSRPGAPSAGAVESAR
jgi:serine/threonine-protein kinase